MRSAGLMALVCLVLCSCVGTTGSDLVEFNVYASGPETAVPGNPMVFSTPRGWNVSLTRARLHIGAMYLDSALPVAGSQATSCVLPGLYVASVPGTLVEGDSGYQTVDVLSGTLQAFSVPGKGMSSHARAGEIWLTGGDVSAQDDSTIILDIAGTATDSTQSMPFDGQVTIGQNRAIPASDPSMPGSNPICKQRIISPIPVDLTPSKGGALVLRINPAGWFENVDFAVLKASPDVAGAFRFSDDNFDQPSRNLFAGLKTASADIYTFTWLNHSPQ